MHNRTRLDYEFDENVTSPKHKLSIFPILVIFYSPTAPTLYLIACQKNHPLEMKMLHTDKYLKQFVLQQKSINLSDSVISTLKSRNGVFKLGLFVRPRLFPAIRKNKLLPLFFLFCNNFSTLWEQLFY